MPANLNNFNPIKKFVRLASVTCVALAIYGCSSIEEDSDENLAMTPEQQQLYMMEKIESWSAAQPDIERILALESDMQLIVNQLASMAELDSDPLEKEKTNNENTESNSNPAALASNTASSDTSLNDSFLSNTDNNIEEAKVTGSTSNQQQTGNSPKKGGHIKASSKSSGHYFPKVGIHIAMFKDVNSAPSGWKYLQSILPAGIINKTPRLEKVNYENTEYYSLRIGPFKSVNTAKKMCVNLHQQQHYCSVVEYKGALLN